jgi:uncharacterized membrane protein
MALALIGLIVSIYMTVYKVTQNQQMCLGSGDCATVNSSRYSEVNGIPVAAIGIAGYAVILAVQLLEGRARFLRDNAGMMLFGLSLVGFLFTLYLIYIEIAVIKALCPFCITSQVTMTLVFGLSVLRLVQEFGVSEEMNAAH